jgi:hypothetical protein
LETCCGYGYGLARKSHSLPRIFKGRRKHSRHCKSRSALRSQHPYLRANRFQGVTTLQRKDNSSEGSRRRLRVHLRYRTWYSVRAPLSVSRFGNVNPIPFRKTKSRSLLDFLTTAFADSLGPTDPCSTAVHMEPFSTLVLKGLT